MIEGRDLAGGAKKLRYGLIGGGPGSFIAGVHRMAIAMAAMSLRGDKLSGFYQEQIPSKIILAAELVTKENAKNHYFPDSIF